MRHMMLKLHDGPVSPAFVWGRLCCGLVLSLAGLIGGASRGTGQTPNTGSSGSSSPLSATVALPQPLVVADFPDPAHPIDWAQYTMPEDCTAAVQRTWGGLVNDDTLRWNPWMPRPSATVQVARTCLSHLRVADIPPFAFEWTRWLAIMAGADSVLHAIVARQLAAVPSTAVQARAKIIGTVFTELLRPPWTSAQVQLARGYLTQLDALGPTVYQERMAARNELLAPAKAAHDVDAQLAGIRDQLQLLQQPQIAALPELAAVGGQDPITGHALTNKETNVWLLTNQLQRLTYLQTFSRDDLTKFANRMHSIETVVWHGKHDLVGTPAPALHCAYYFPTPTSAIPIADSVPFHGHLSLLVFLGGGTETQSFYPVLRRLQKDLPAVALLYEDQLTGSFAGQLLVAHPEQEAILRHQYVVDSLGLKGAFCVTGNPHHTAPDGRALPSADPNREVYTKGNYFFQKFVIDPIGTVTDGPSVLGDVVDWSDLEWYLRRMQTKATVGAVDPGRQ